MVPFQTTRENRVPALEKQRNHAPDFETRVRHFKTLQKAYQKEYIDGGAFSLYLERMYNYKFRQRYVIEGVYNEQNKIDTLILLLELN